MTYLKFALKALFALFLAGVLLLAVLVMQVSPQLPSIDVLREVQLQVPLRVYAEDGGLIAEFGEKRRTPVTYAQVPEAMVQAFLAAEDDRFFEHPGVDYQGLIRAAVQLVLTGEKRQGGSTITMQVARNFFLSREKTYLRKFTEILLALKIERELSKPEILELYLNKIYLGQRAYGVAAAAQVYYGRSLDELSIAQIAMIAGLPKAPSRDNPVTDPQRAKIRRDYVLGRMHQLGHIDTPTYEAARAEVDEAKIHTAEAEVPAAYIAEWVRAEMFERYGNEAYTLGLSVYTTIRPTHQHAANAALHNALLAYDERHGYRGAEARVEDWSEERDEAELADLLKPYPSSRGLIAALVVALEEQSATIAFADGSRGTIDWDGMKWARAYKSVNRRGAAPKRADQILAVGDIVRVVARAQETDAKAKPEAEQVAGDAADAAMEVAVPPVQWDLRQLPQIQGALVALDPDTGAVLALNGGFDFYRSKFNRVTQAKRQPGSSFKPFIYSAALENGFTAASVINDAPVVFDDPSLEGAWRPENYSGKFYGPTRFREALVNSRNLISIRILDAIGVDAAIAHASRFGFDTRQMPRNLSLSLGSGLVTPLEIASGYTVFANGGYRIEPYLIERIVAADGEIIEQHQPLHVCRECPEAEAEFVAEQARLRALAEGLEAQATQPSAMEPPVSADAPMLTDSAQLEVPGGDDAPTAPEPRVAQRVVSSQNVWLINSVLQDVIKRGTGRRALELKRGDLSGKTGTTNDQRDAWFCGYNPSVVATAWVGFDELQPLGARETGGQAALPMWIDFMREALAGAPEIHRPQPSGLVSVRIDPANGLLAGGGQAGAIFETFREEHVPQQVSEVVVQHPDGRPGGTIPEQLF